MGAEMSWGRVIEDITGLHFIELSVDQAEPPYPAFVSIEAEGGSVVADDARRYALALLLAADVADERTDAAFEAAGYEKREPTNGSEGEK